MPLTPSPPLAPSDPLSLTVATSTSSSTGRKRRGGRPRQTHCSRCQQPYTKFYKDNRHGLTGFCKPCWQRYYKQRHWYAYSTRFHKLSLPLLRYVMRAYGHKNLNVLILEALRRFDKRLKKIR